MIIGSGQLANVFKGYDNSEVCIFASGVSDSTCTNEKEFERERKLLLSCLKQHEDKRFVYFSSCALSAEAYSMTAYYQHKLNMEFLVKENSSAYYLFRLPQVFGELIQHSTLINYIYKSVLSGSELVVYDEAYRYVLELTDVRRLVEAYLTSHPVCLTVDLANPYRYRVVDVVRVFERLLNKKACCRLVAKKDKYILNLNDMLEFMLERNIDLGFGPCYLENKLLEKLTAY